MKHADHCWYCLEKRPKEELRKCGKCRMVTYCSSECQTKAWPTHKKGCSPLNRDTMEALADAGDTRMKDMNDKISKWLYFWKDNLTLKWVMLGMNVAKYPRNRLATHCFLIELKERVGAKSDGKLFTMIRGTVIPRQELIKFLEENQSDPRFVEEYKKDERGIDVIQVALHIPAEGIMRNLYYSLLDIEDRRTRQRTPWESRMGDALEEAWPEALMNTIDTGDPSNTDMFIQVELTKHLPADF